jgi:transposase
MLGQHDGKTYRPWEPQRSQQEAQSPAAKLPEGDVVFFLLATVPRLDLRRFSAPYATATRGAPPFDPAMMGCLLLYAYGVGVFSSRTIALACERNLAFLAIVGTERPDFRTISDFRKQHLEVFQDVFVHVVRLAREAGVVQLGNVSTAGTKSQGHASRHKAMRYGYMQKEVERLREEIEALVTAADQQDEAEDAALGRRRGDALPAEVARREARVATIEAAMHRLEAQTKADAARQRTGKKRRGPPPPPVEETPDDKAQSNWTDPALHSMRTNTKGWDDCGNAQASVDGTCQSIVACDVTEAANDTQQAEPLAQATLTTLAQAGIERPTDESGTTQAIPATLDNGDYSEAAVAALETLGLDPYIATERQRHHGPQAEASEMPLTVQERMGSERTDARREGVVCQAQGHRRTRVWPEQRSAGVPPLRAAWLGKPSWRMATGLPDA